MIKLEKISKYYVNNNSLNLGLLNTTLDLPNKGLILLKGESGSGKSTLINILAGITKPDSGKIILNNQYLKSETDKNLLFNNVTVINQDYKLLEHLTVFDNLMLGFKEELTYSEKEQRINDVLELIELTNCKNCRAMILSGGEKQRIAIGRSIISNVAVILADEPTANLDEDNSKAVFDILKNISKDRLVVLSTHEIDKASEIADYEIELQNGQVVKNTCVDNTNIQSDLVAKKSNINFSYLIKALRLVKKNILTNIIGVLFIAVLIVAYFFITNFKSDNYAYTVKESTVANVDSSRIIVNEYYKHKDNPYLKKLMSENNSFISELYLDYLYNFDDWFTTTNNVKQGVFIQITNVMNQDYKLLKGSKPEKDNDIILFINEKDKDSQMLLELCDETLLSTKENNDTYNICGIASVLSDNKRGTIELLNPILYSENFSKDFLYQLNKEAFFNDFYSSSNNNKIEASVISNTTDSILNQEENCIKFGVGLDKVLYYKNYSIDITPYTIIDLDSSYDATLLAINNDTIKRIIESLDFNVSIFLNNIQDKDDVLLKLSDEGIISYSPYNNLVDINFSNSKASDLRIYMIVYFTLIVTFFISYCVMRVHFYRKTLRNQAIIQMLGMKIEKINRAYIYEMLISILFQSLIFFIFSLWISKINCDIQVLMNFTGLAIVFANLIECFYLGKISKLPIQNILSKESNL